MVARGAHAAHRGSLEPLLAGSRSNDLRLVAMRCRVRTRTMGDMALDSQKIVILGGTSGIGLATAQLATAEGATVVVASSNPERVDAALANLPVNAEGYALDLRREEEIRDLFERLGEFDHLAYTAGESLPLGPIGTTNLETARRALEIRFWGAYAAVKHAAPRLRPGGSIVLSSGIASARPQATWTVASSICGAVEALTRALAVELAPIRVNAVAPGVVRSNLWRDMSEDDRSAMYASLAQALPAGRAGEVGDVAETFLYLMRNGYSTGTVVTIDGGSVLV
jgi:NAD(P)-dependent dehydrogenase (short-subunit alcohol dehydrogenase family)